jgi:hypothetical protein
MAKKNELKEYQNNLMQGAKGTIGLGIMTGIGTYGFSRVGSNHPAVKGVADTTVAGLQLANVGNLAGVGMSLTKMPGAGKTKSSKVTDPRLKKMLGK